MEECSMKKFCTRTSKDSEIIIYVFTGLDILQ